MSDGPAGLLNSDSDAIRNTISLLVVEVSKVGIAGLMSILEGPSL